MTVRLKFFLDIALRDCITLLYVDEHFFEFLFKNLILHSTQTDSNTFSSNVIKSGLSFGADIFETNRVTPPSFLCLFVSGHFGIMHECRLKRSKVRSHIFS